MGGKLHKCAKFELGGHFLSYFLSWAIFSQTGRHFAQFLTFPGCSKLLLLRTKARAPGRPTTPGRFLTPNGIALDKFPWFVQLPVTSGGCFAPHNASGVQRCAHGNMLFWPFWGRKPLLAPRANGRASGRPQARRTVPNPEQHSIRQTPMVSHGSSDVWRVFCAP